MLTHHFEIKIPATHRTSQCWGTTSRPRHRQHNKTYKLVLGHHFETKTPATNRTSQCWGTTSSQRHRKQIIHLNAGALMVREVRGRWAERAGRAKPFKISQLNGSARGPYNQVAMNHWAPRPPPTLHPPPLFPIPAPLSPHPQSTHHQPLPAPNPSTTNPFPCPPSLRDQDTGNTSYILVLGHHFETKTPATNRQ